jgi:cation diffusion facilitator family transporter
MSDQVQNKMQQPKEQQQIGNLLLLSGVIDFTLALLKIVVGWFANSHALIADGIHSFSDLVTDIMVWILNRVGTEEPDDDHPYGHARFETLGALILGSMLIIVAGFLVYDSVLRLIDIESVEIPTWPALVAALASIGAKEWLYQITRSIGKKARSNLLAANAWHHRSDALSSVIVLIGVGGAILGVAWLEMVAAIGVAFMIALVSLKLVKESIEELVDTALAESTVADIQETIENASGVRGVHSLRTRKMGSAVILDIHLQVDPVISVSEGHYIGAWVTQQLGHKFREISDVTVHIDFEDDAHVKILQLPLRTEARRELLAAWKNFLPEEDIQKLTLHYLDEVINVEVYLIECPTADKPEQQKTLTEAATSIIWLGEIEFWYR